MDFLEKIAGEVGLDFARLKADVASPEVEKKDFRQHEAGAGPQHSGNAHLHAPVPN